MKKIWVKLGVVFFMGVALAIGFTKAIETSSDKKDKIITKQDNTEEKEAKKVSVTIGDQVLYVDLDSYLVGVVAGEMPASFELEALKAQVVASRTFVYSRNLEVDNTTNTQVYLTDEQMKSNWKEQYVEKKHKIEQAVQETKDEVMKYDGQYISALFFSSSNGYTENSEDYFTGSIPYLKSVDCHWDLEIDPNVKRQKHFTQEQLQKAFSCNTLDFSITSYKKSGRVEILKVDDKEYTGRQVRELLALASSCFTIEKDNDGYTFTTLGSGHGVGMSQYGAQGMAKEGKNYKDILLHFYTGVEITNN